MENDRDDKNSLNIKGETVENTSKVAHDPGWNDPPKVTYGALGQTKFIKKGLLNKRVSFPLNSNSPTMPSTSSLSATPPKGDIRLPFSSGDSPLDTSKSTFHSPFVNPLHTSTSDSSPKNDVVETLSHPSKPASKPKKGEEKTADESSLEAVMNIFEKVISKLMTPENCDKIEYDIRKRLEVMKKMWREGKLSGVVQEKIMHLAKALQMDQGSMANDLHIEMIVDHTGEVSAWMPGVRKLVHCSMLAAERASKVDDNKVDLAAAEKNDEPHSQQTSDVDKPSG